MSLEKDLRDCLREMEAGADLEAVLSKRPRNAGALRPHLLVRARLLEAGGAQPVPEGAARGLARLTSAIREEREQGGIAPMKRIPMTPGFALKLAGVSAVVAVIAISAALLTGNMRVDFGGSSASANLSSACLDQVLGNLADPQDDHFDLSDLLAARDAVRDQNTDPRYDRDGDGDVDIDDLMVYMQELKACFAAQYNP